jgi:Na+-transporting methylmalonyl-CoA/oxaloacetate decarboxylase gamma subunit
MEINWGEAWQIGGIGFGLVFAVLAILAVAIWLIGLVIRKIDSRHGGGAVEEKKEKPPAQPVA